MMERAASALPGLLMNVHLNSSPRRNQSLNAFDSCMFGVDAVADVQRFMAPLECIATPLHRMDALAREMQIHRLFVKDESRRSSLGSFKALGGAYAVIRLVLAEAERRLGRPLPVGALHQPAVREIAGELTVTCATHGGEFRMAGLERTSCGQWRRTYCEIDPEVTDRWGIPVLRFHWKWSEYEKRQAVQTLYLFVQRIERPSCTAFTMSRM